MDGLLSAPNAWQPVIFAQAFILVAIYAFAASRIGWKEIRFWRVGCFFGAILSFILAFGSPLDSLSDSRLFAAHMLQHILETMAMTPLLMLSLSPRWIRSILKRRGLGPIFRFFTKPILAAAVYNVAFGLFHLPSLYDLALQNENFHLFEHTVFFITALALWWPILDMNTEETKLTPGWKLLYLLLNYNLMMPLSILFIVSQHPLYTLYAHAPGTFGLVPLADQQLSGFIMIVGMFIPYLWVGIRTYKQLDVLVWVE